MTKLPTVALVIKPMSIQHFRGCQSFIKNCRLDMSLSVLSINANCKCEIAHFSLLILQKNVICFDVLMHKSKIVHMKYPLANLEKEVPYFPLFNLLSNSLVLFKSILQSPVHFLHDETKLKSPCIRNLNCFHKILRS